MKLTPDQMQQSHADYAQAFNEDAPAKPEQTDDQAFGLAPEDAATEGEQPAEGAPAEEAAETPAQEAAEQQGEESAESGQPGGETPAEAGGNPDGQVRDADELGGDANGQAEGAQDTGTDKGQVDIEKETQRLKSWEGRLKKLEAELKQGKSTVETPAVEALEEVSEQADNQGQDQLGEAAEKAADAVEDGQMTADQAMKQLAEDFGEDFVKMIEVIAKSIAQKAGTDAAHAKVSEIGATVDDIINHINDKDAKAHFKQIAAAHPDFADVGQSEGFKEYLDSLGEGKAGAEQAVQSGSADEIIKLLDDYKAWCEARSPQKQEADHQPAADPVVNEQMDAAEGVRSSGMALPEQPAKASNSYEDAWKEFS